MSKGKVIGFGQHARIKKKKDKEEKYEWAFKTFSQSPDMQTWVNKKCREGYEFVDVDVQSHVNYGHAGKLVTMRRELEGEI